MIFDWDHVYLLGWYDHEGRSYLTTWDGNLPMVYVVVHGANGFSMPFWDAPVPSGAFLEEIPQGQDGLEYARRTGGFLALGWYIEKGITRKVTGSAGTFR